MTREAFNESVLQMSRKLFICAFRILKRQEESEDAVQETFIKIWNMGEKLDSYRSIEALATTMIRNHCIDQLRKRGRILFENEEIHYNGSAVVTPFDIMEQKESAGIIESIIKKMPEIYRNVIRLRDMEGLEYEEIATLTNQNINTLRVNLSRARSLLRDEYKKIYNEDKRAGQVTG